MKQQVIGGLTALVLVSTVSLLPSQAQTFEDLQDLQKSSEDIQQSSDPTVPIAESVNTAPADSITSNNLNPVQDSISFQPTQSTQEPYSFQALTGSSRIIQVNAHSLEQQPAATLYVRNIPLLTFVNAAADKAVTQEADGEATAVVSQAHTLGARIEQFESDDAQLISVRWDAQRSQYVVMVEGEELVALGNGIMLPDTTENLAEDALQVANRLRRLVGGAAPITEIEGRPRPQVVAAVRSNFTGMASWYGPGFNGRRSASGEVFNQNAMTAAHRTLPFGTQVRVTNLNNGQQVVVRINDRGPFSHGRVIDLSAGAARAIGLMSAGVGPVQIEVLGQDVVNR
jgi:rare lipoprotein A